MKIAKSRLSRKDSFLVRVIFWLHLPVVFLYFGLLLVPTSLFAGRVVFHFWYFVFVMGAEILWGLYMWQFSGEMDIVCPLTSLMQFLRGYSLCDERNYGHSYIAELASVLGFRLRYGVVNYLMLAAGVVIIVEYLIFT